MRPLSRRLSPSVTPPSDRGIRAPSVGRPAGPGWGFPHTIGGTARWWPVPALYAVLIAAGFLRSLQFTAYNTIAYADIMPKNMNWANVTVSKH